MKKNAISILMVSVLIFGAGIVFAADGDAPSKNETTKPAQESKIEKPTIEPEKTPTQIKDDTKKYVIETDLNKLEDRIEKNTDRQVGIAKDSINFWASIIIILLAIAAVITYFVFYYQLKNSFNETKKVALDSQKSAKESQDSATKAREDAEKANKIAEGQVGEIFNSFKQTLEEQIKKIVDKKMKDFKTEAKKEYDEWVKQMKNETEKNTQMFEHDVKGKKFLSEKKFVEAEAEFNEMRKLDEEDPIVWINLGITHAQWAESEKTNNKIEGFKDHYEKAINNYNKCMLKNPDKNIIIPCQYNLACAYGKIGKIQEMCEILRKLKLVTSNFKEKISKDSDFAEHLNKDYFKEFLI